MQESSEEIALSIEETNKLRLSLGLKPLDVGPKPDVAHDNYKKHLEEQQKQKSKEERIQMIKREKAKAQNTRRMGKTLAEEAEDDALDWVKKSKQREQQRLKELESAKQSEQVRSYTSKDLKGLKVGHKMQDIQETGEAILVLRDTKVTEEEDDELVDLSLLEKERTRKNLENKFGRAYNVYEQDEKKGILSQYDEEQEDVGFQLSAGGKVKTDREDKKKTVSESIKKATVSLEYEKTREIADYYTKEEVSFKKPKKKKKRKDNLRKHSDEEDVEMTPAVPFANSNLKSLDRVNFVDDDDLTQALARARKVNQKKPIVDVHMSSESEEERGGIVISETTEFVAALDPTAIMPVKNQQELAPEDDEPTEDYTMEVSHQPRVDDQPAVSHQSRVDEQPTMDEQSGQQMSINGNSEQTTEKQPPETAIPSLDAEPLVSSGLAATLALLNRKGLLETKKQKENQQDMSERERFKWLAEKRRIEALKKQEEEQFKTYLQNTKKERGKMDAWERQQVEKKKFEREIELEQEKFKNYVPEIKLYYKDESGRDLTPKEAYKLHSHKFHGVTPGANKMEKKLMKIREAMHQEQMSSGDTPLGTLQAMQDKTKEMATPAIVVSKGKKMMIPTPKPQSQPPSHPQTQTPSEQQSEPSQTQTSSEQQVESQTPASVPVETKQADVETVTVQKQKMVTVQIKEAAPLEREKLSFGLSLAPKRKANGLESLVLKKKK